MNSCYKPARPFNLLYFDSIMTNLVNGLLFGPPCIDIQTPLLSEVCGRLRGRLIIFDRACINFVPVCYYRG